MVEFRANGKELHLRQTYILNKWSSMYHCMNIGKVRAKNNKNKIQKVSIVTKIIQYCFLLSSAQIE